MKARYIFTEHRDAEARIKSGIALSRLVLNGRSALKTEHLNEVLRIAICKVTEAYGNKHSTRFCSLKAYYAEPAVQLQHEHVWTVKSLRDKLLKSEAGNIESVLRSAVACTVTKDEHENLNKVSSTIHGWKRYGEAQIQVVDVQETQKQGQLVFVDVKN